jgi:recombinational DNA repair protein (RecF pathway)
MSSRQYITRAIVCGSKQNMTSDKSYLLFTEELGMLWAVAKSVRVEKSKQRCALQDFSIIRVSLVQGRAAWRIGSVEALSNPFLASDSRVSRGGVSFVVKKLRQYVHGESALLEVFVDAVDTLETLSAKNDLNIIATYQKVFEFRLLAELGYIKIVDEVRPLVESSSVSSAVEKYDISMDSEVTKSIENASQVSHL